MKNKFLIAAFFSLISVAAFAQENPSENGEKLSSRKQQMIANLNEHKAVIDQTISCINSAQDGLAIKKCHEAREAAMKKIQENNLANRKAELQNQMNKLNEKEQNLKNKSATGDRK